MLIYFTIKAVFQLHYSEKCVRKNTSLTGMSKSIIRVRELCLFYGHYSIAQSIHY